MHGNLWKWFESYLTNRRNLVQIINTLSDTLPVLSVVPQGAIISSNLCESETSSSEAFLFVDDTKLLGVILQPLDSLLLQKDLDSLNNWSIVNELYFGIPKCVFLTFNNKSPTVSHSNITL